MRVCLIHGSTQSPHGWDLLVKELMAWDIEVTAVDLPQVDEGAAFFAREAARQNPQGEPPVVVAHSAAGLILPFIPAHMEVARLVYLAAIVPQPQASLMQRFAAAPDMFQPDWLGKDPTKNSAVALDFLFHDCEPRVQQWALTTMRLWFSRTLVSEVCPLETLPAVPATYISASLDRTINPQWWEHEAQLLLGAPPLRLDTGHAPHVSRPRELVHLLKGSH